MFHANSTTRIRDITDGTSSTLAIGERAALFAQSPWAGVMYTGTCMTTPGAPVFQTIIETTPSMVMARIGRRPLNDPFSEPYDFFSPHGNVVMFAFADGSAHRLHTGIDPVVLQGLATHGSGEVVNFSD
jgi:prepilin-type processing-associated H-X9-DG protein